MSISGLKQRDICLQSTIYPFPKQDNCIYIGHPFLRKSRPTLSICILVRNDEYLREEKTCQMC